MQRVAPPNSASSEIVTENPTLSFVTWDDIDFDHHQQQQQYCYVPTISRLSSDDNNNEGNDAENCRPTGE